MKHVAYPKIKNAYCASVVEEFKKVDTLWYVTEKMHGANISFQWDREKNEIRMASRNLFCPDNFFGIGEIYKKIEKDINDLIQIVAGLHRKADTVCIFGEIIGQGVQKGVYYTQNREFVIFDILTYKDGELLMQLNKHEVRFYTSKLGLLTVPSLFEGTLEECLKFSNHFESGIPRLLGDTEIIADNICEGVVIKQINPTVNFVQVGEESVFLALKNKNKRFEEVRRTPKKQKDVKLGQSVIDDCKALVNDNRFNSARSKLGEFHCSSQIGEFLEHISTDILADIDKKDKTFVKTLNLHIANFLRSKLSVAPKTEDIVESEKTLIGIKLKEAVYQ